MSHAKNEGRARDVALSKLAATRTYLIDEASKIAYALAKKNGEVTSKEVWDELRKRAAKDYKLEAELKARDPRWMGVVFNRSCWHRIHWVALGSHKRPISVWQLQPELPFDWR